MRQQRNLHILSSCTHVKVSNFSSFAVSSKPSSSNRRANSHTSTKLHPARSLPPCRTENVPKIIPFRNFQTRAASTRIVGDTNEFEDPSIKYEEVSSHDRQRTGFRKPPKEVSVGPFLVRRGESRAVDKSVRERAIQLTPWSGTPSLLHALGFIQELEEKYGKIWWAGLSKEKANPYEYNPVIIVIFEDAASLSRIPGFTTPSPPELPKLLNPPESMSNLNPNLVDLGPSPSLDPLANPHSQALLKHVEARSARNKFTAPLFVPWSECLNAAAYRQGGPALDDVLPFLGPKKAGELPPALPAAHGEQPEENLSTTLTTQDPGEQPITFKKASWEEWDEVVNIDAVLRKYANETLYLPSPASVASKAAQANPYFRPHIRLSVARAMVEFAGFSEQPTPSMARVVKQWQKELDERVGNVWVPWNESPPDALDVAEDKEENEEDVSDPPDSDDELQFDDLTPVVWPIVKPRLPDTLQTGDDLAPRKQQYQRISEDDDGEDDVDEWEGIGVHPLQHPRGLEPDSQGTTQAEGAQFDLTATVRSPLSALPTVLDQLSQISTPTEPPNSPPILAQIEKEALANDDSPSSSRKSRHSEELRDPWRTDPRPFRSGLGGDELPSFYPPSTNMGRNGSSSKLPRQEQWSKPGLGSMSPEARERGAMASGSHSTPSKGWDRDRRGRKLRSREEVEMLKEFGLGNIDDLAAERMERLRAARARGEFGKRETWQVREEGRQRGSNLEENAARISALAGQERRQKVVKNLKDRLRAILDGTKVD